MVTNVTIVDGKVIGYISLPEFAANCGIEKSTARQWIRRGKIEERYLLKIGEQWFVNASIPYDHVCLRKKRTKPELYEKVWFTQDIANLFKINPETVRRWIRSGELKSEMTSKKYGNRIRNRDLEEFAINHSRRTRDIWNANKG